MSMPSPSTVSSALWAHLLRKDKPTVLHSSTSSTPIAPVDKTGTSVRLLLNDTQSTLEKFSKKIDNLIKGVEDTRTQALDNHQEWAEDIERSTKLIVGEAFDKCKASLQQSIGQPTQTSQLTDFCRLFLDHAERLQTSIDTIRVLSQTQSQALQTIQDQQGQILTALLPLLPLLQAVPLHIDSAKNDLKDAVRSTVLARDNTPSASILVQKRKSPYADGSPRLSSLKRARLGFDRVNKQLPSPSRSRGAEETSSSSANVSSASRIQTPGSAGSWTTTPPMIQKEPPRSSKTGPGSHSRQSRLKPPQDQLSTRRPHDTSTTDAATLSSSLHLNNRVSSLSVDEHRLGALSVSNKNTHQSASPSSVSRPRHQSPRNVLFSAGVSTGLGPSESLRVSYDTPGSYTSHPLKTHSVLDRSITSTPSMSARRQSVKDFSVKPGRRCIPLLDEDDDEDDY